MLTFLSSVRPYDGLEDAKRYPVGLHVRRFPGDRLLLMSPSPSSGKLVWYPLSAEWMRQTLGIVCDTPTPSNPTSTVSSPTTCKPASRPALERKDLNGTNTIRGMLEDDSESCTTQAEEANKRSGKRYAMPHESTGDHPVDLNLEALDPFRRTEKRRRLSVTGGGGSKRVYSAHHQLTLTTLQRFNVAANADKRSSVASSLVQRLSTHAPPRVDARKGASRRPFALDRPVSIYVVHEFVRYDGPRPLCFSGARDLCHIRFRNLVQRRPCNPAFTTATTVLRRHLRPI